VDGFTPNRHALAKRVRAFAPLAGRATVICGDVATLDPERFAPTRVYMDPPYADRRGYGAKLSGPAHIARRWAHAGHLVLVSEAIPLAEADATIEITHLRSGQSRRSLTNNQAEWISRFGTLDDSKRTSTKTKATKKSHCAQQFLPFV
jgi:site-specific DNA-adenine methylase